MAQPIFSIVIPTKNRHDTLAEVLDIILSMPDKDFEVVVQDCSDTDNELRKIADRLNDARLKCHKSPPNITMTENWNLAILNCSGKYVSFIGDDDLVGADVLKVVRWANENDLDAVCEGTPPASYWWPNYTDLSKEQTFDVPKCSGQIEYANGEIEATRASYSVGDKSSRLPAIYRGIIKLSCVRKSYEVSGKYFDGIAPDCYSVFSLALNVKRYSIIHYSFFIAGGSPKSNSGKGVTGGSSKDTPEKGIKGHTPIEHWLEYSLSEWPQIIPMVRINQALMSEGMIKAFTNNKRPDLVKNIDIEKLYLLSILYSPQKTLQILSKLPFASKYTGRSIPKLITRILYCSIKKSIPFLNRLIAKKFLKPKSSKDALRINNVVSLKDALAVHKKWFPDIENLLRQAPQVTTNQK